MLTLTTSRTQPEISVCACVCGTLHCIVRLLNITIFIYNFYTWLILMFRLFFNALYEWNVTKTNSCVHLNVTGK